MVLGKSSPHKFALRKYAYFTKSTPVDSVNQKYSEKECQQNQGIITKDEKGRYCLLVIPPEIRPSATKTKSFMLLLTTRDNRDLILEEKGIRLIRELPRLSLPKESPSSVLLLEVTQ